MSHIKNVLITLTIAFAVVSFWRGVWGIMDIYLFPENLALSFSISIIIGIIILYLIQHKFKSLI